MQRFLKYIFTVLVFISISYAQDSLKKVSFYMHWKHQFEFAGFYMAKEKGFYKDLGLDVELHEVSFRSKPIIDKIEKDLYAFGSSSPTLIIDKANGKKVVVLGAIYQSTPEVLLSLKSSGIKSIKDFKNKTIMMNPKLTQTAPYISMINSQGLSLLDMKRVDYSYRIDELINKEVDIAPYFISNQTYTLQKQGLAYDVWDPKDYGFDFYHNLIYTGEKTLDHDPFAVKNFKEATLKGFEYAFNNIEESVELILQKYNTQNKTKEHLLYEADILKKYAYLNDKPLGTIEKNKIQRIYDIYNFLGLMENRLDVDAFVYEDNKKFFLSKKEKEYLKKKKIIKMCIDPNWMPFEKINEESKHIGISADYFKIFKKEYNLKIETIKTKSWNESLEFIKNKKCDIISLITPSEDRKEYLSFTKPYLKVPIVLATKQNVPFITDFTSLNKEHKIGTPKAYIYKQLLKRKYPNLNIVEVRDNEQGLKQVIRGNLFGYIDALPSIGYMFQTEFTGELKIAGKFDELNELSIAIKDDEILLGIFNKAINSLPNEEHRQIMNKWIAINYDEDKIDFKLALNVIFAVCVFILLLLYRQYFLKKSNKDLQKIIDEKTKELKELNKNLEKKVEKSIEENREKDKILYRQSKMAAMGEMIGNIAHQWRQPLNNINSNIMSLDIILSEKNLKSEKVEREFTAIENQTEYLSKTIDDFQNFLKPSNVIEKFNIKTVFEKNISMFGSGFKRSKIELVSNIQDVFILGNQSELLQVTINILNNAKEAFETNHTLEKRYIFIDCYEQEDFAVIKIKDNAGGIDKKIKEKIYDAYFTTKAKSKGTGLGLYMSYQIVVNKFNGEVNMINEHYSYNDKICYGATFTIRIPLKEKESIS